MKVRSGVVLVEILNHYLLVADKEARKSCAYYREINESGAFIWKGLKEGRNMDEIVTSFIEEYEVPDEVDIRKEAASFVEKLREQNYIIDVEA